VSKGSRESLRGPLAPYVATRLSGESSFGSSEDLVVTAR
jgi:hypothetical protein